MKQFWRELGAAVILGMIMPGFILHIVTFSAHRHIRDPVNTVPLPEALDSAVYIPVLHDDGTVKELELESYITGVVLAEMPASFEPEALKAQSVVARTYTLRALSGKGKHESAAVCTESACCQAYREPKDYLLAGGSEENVEKVRRAVLRTAGQVLTYNGDLIEATYFSCSGGSTEDAVAVWGAEIPYLQAVASPGEERATYYTDSITFTAEELQEKLEIQQSNAPSEWFGDVSYTAGGGVESIVIGDKEFRGTELRKRLNLRSTAFTVTTEGNCVTFHTRGYGHRVGMSQYGADAMAASGSDYREILDHYYQGTVLETVQIDKVSALG